MNAENMRDLARVRYERAVELVSDAEALLKSGSYKSANNRAYYSAEKAIKAALAARGKDSDTHNGIIKVFNMEFVHTPSKFFSREDLSIIQGMERIRSSSDYDDFYIASKEECEEQIIKSKSLLKQVETFLSSEGILTNT